jgi:hypothetical protein
MDRSMNHTIRLLELANRISNDYRVETHRRYLESSELKPSNVTAAQMDKVPTVVAISDGRGARSRRTTSTSSTGPKSSPNAEHSQPFPYDVPDIIAEYFRHAPYPHDGSWPETKTEPFPDFVDDCCEQIEDIDAHNAYLSHCIIHCDHYVCRHIRRIDQKQNVSRESRCFPIAEEPLMEVEANEPAKRLQERIAKLLRADVREVEEMYKKTDKIKVDLKTATALVERLKFMNILDIRRHLLASVHYTPTLLYNSKRFATAALRTSTIIDGISNYITRSLSTLPSQTRSVSLADLELEMINLVRWNVIDWMCEWVWAPKEDRKRRGNPTTLKVAMEEEKGVKVLWELVKDRISVVVAVLAWWDGLVRTEDGLKIEVEEEQKGK